MDVQLNWLKKCISNPETKTEDNTENTVENVLLARANSNELVQNLKKNADEQAKIEVVASITSLIDGDRKKHVAGLSTTNLASALTEMRLADKGLSIMLEFANEYPVVLAEVKKNREKAEKELLGYVPEHNVKKKASLGVVAYPSIWAVSDVNGISTIVKLLDDPYAATDAKSTSFSLLSSIGVIHNEDEVEIKSEDEKKEKGKIIAFRPTASDGKYLLVKLANDKSEWMNIDNLSKKAADFVNAEKMEYHKLQDEATSLQNKLNAMKKDESGYDILKEQVTNAFRKADKYKEEHVDKKADVSSNMVPDTQAAVETENKEDAEEPVTQLDYNPFLGHPQSKDDPKQERPGVFREIDQEYCPNTKDFGEFNGVNKVNPEIENSEPNFESEEVIKDAALNIFGKIVKHKDGYHVMSEKGKHLGGPYSSREKAVKRLRQCEFFKNKKADFSGEFFPSEANLPIALKDHVEVVNNPYAEGMVGTVVDIKDGNCTIAVDEGIFGKDDKYIIELDKVKKTASNQTIYFNKANVEQYNDRKVTSDSGNLISETADGYHAELPEGNRIFIKKNDVANIETTAAEKSDSELKVGDEVEFKSSLEAGPSHGTVRGVDGDYVAIDGYDKRFYIKELSGVKKTKIPIGKPEIETNAAAQIQIAPDGTQVAGTPTQAPDGTYVGGKPILGPDGKYKGDGTVTASAREPFTDVERRFTVIATADSFKILNEDNKDIIEKSAADNPDSLPYDPATIKEKIMELKAARRTLLAENEKLVTQYRKNSAANRYISNEVHKLEAQLRENRVKKNVSVMSPEELEAFTKRFRFSPRFQDEPATETPKVEEPKSELELPGIEGIDNEIK
jgi:hypothetical protein